MYFQIGDGKRDCSDMSDECPTTTSSRISSTLDGFYSQNYLINNPVLRVFVWIMGVLALIGNTVSICKRTSQDDCQVYHKLKLNLFIKIIKNKIQYIIKLRSTCLSTATMDIKMCGSNRCPNDLNITLFTL